MPRVSEDDVLLEAYEAFSVPFSAASPVDPHVHHFAQEKNHGFAHGWHDIFAYPEKELEPYLRVILAGQVPTDWLNLIWIVIGLILLDALVLSRLYREVGLPGQVVRALEELFRSAQIGVAGATTAGSVTKSSLISECKRSEIAAALFGLQSLGTKELGPAVEAKLEALAERPDSEVSWKKFQEFYQNHIFDQSSYNTEAGCLGKAGSHWTALGIWVLVAVAFNIMVFLQKGTNAGMQWCAGYLLEWLLSIDNLFVFHLVFQSYHTPRALLHKALFWGVLGAVFCRLWFFAILSSLIRVFHWVRAAFGLLLIWSGIQVARGDDEDEDVTNNCVVRCLRYALGSRILNEYDLENHGIFVWKNGRWAMTLLGPVIVCVEAVDVIFALDSVSAKVAQIPDYYISYSSSVIAIFGLRSMFFIIQDLVDCFELLKYGLCFLLVFIGIELIAAPWFELPPSAVVVVIVAVFTICTVGSRSHGRAQPEVPDSGQSSRQ